MEAFFSKAFCNAFVCNVFIATVEPKNRNVYTYSAPLLLRYGHLHRLLFLEMCLYSFFVCFFFLYLFGEPWSWHQKTQRLPFPSSTTAEWKSGNFCHTHIFSLFHGKHHRARDTWKWQPPEEPILCWWFSKTNLSTKRVTQPTDLNGRLAHKSNSEFLFFGSAKSPKNRAWRANERKRTGPPPEPEMRSEGLLRKSNRLGYTDRPFFPFQNYFER